jgi:hypothetical protein
MLRLGGLLYIGKTINDARKVDGVWYSDQNGKILRLNLQHAVQTLCTCDNGANNRASCEAAERELTGKRESANQQHAVNMISAPRSDGSTEVRGAK